MTIAGPVVSTRTDDRSPVEPDGGRLQAAAIFQAVRGEILVRYAEVATGVAPDSTAVAAAD